MVFVDLHRHALANLSLLKRRRPYHLVPGALEGVNAFFLGAGPSLEAGLERVQRVRNRFTIAHVSACDELQRRGFRPDAVILPPMRAELEPRRFVALDNFASVDLVTDLRAHPDDLRHHSGRLVFPNWYGSELPAILRGSLDFSVAPNRGAAALSIELLCQLGARRIFLVANEMFGNEQTYRIRTYRGSGMTGRESHGSVAEIEKCVRRHSQKGIQLFSVAADAVAIGGVRHLPGYLDRHIVPSTHRRKITVFRGERLCAPGAISVLESLASDAERLFALPLRAWSSIYESADFSDLLALLQPPFYAGTIALRNERRILPLEVLRDIRRVAKETALRHALL